MKQTWLLAAPVALDRVSRPSLAGGAPGVHVWPFGQKPSRWFQPSFAPLTFSSISSKTFWPTSLMKKLEVPG